MMDYADFLQRKPCPTTDITNAKKTTRRPYLRRVRARVPETRVPIGSWARSVLLEGLPRNVEAARRYLSVRALRLGVLPSAGRGGRGDEVLLSRVLHGLAGALSKQEHLSKDRRQARASYRSRSRAWPKSDLRRSGSPYRRGQTQQSSIKPGRLPRSRNAYALSRREDVQC